MSARSVLLLPVLASLLFASAASAQADDDLLAPLTPVGKKPDKTKKKKTKPAGEDAVPAGKALLSVNLFTQGKGAHLFIDGAEVGPLQPGDAPRVVAPGSHKVGVKRLGYKDFTLNVPIQAGAVVQVPVSLEPVAAVVSFDSEPPGADVLVDGVKLGVTPLKDTLVAPGFHEVVLKHPRFGPHVESLTMRAGKDYGVSGKLENGSDRPQRDQLTPSNAVAESSPLTDPGAPVVTHDTPWYGQWYVWAGVGAVAAATVTGVALATQPRPLTQLQVCGGRPCDGTLNAPPGSALRF